MPDLLQVERSTLPDGSGQLKLKLGFHPGQRRAWDSAKRIVLVLAGWQSGKTIIGPPWLFREIKARGPGDYIVACPTYPLMTKKVLPEFIHFFDTQCGLGKFTSGKNVFTLSDYGARTLFDGAVPAVPTKVFFGHAGDPDSLESATAKAAWLDEAGQSGFRLESWEAVLGRLSIHTGRVLVTTRPYNLGWVKTQLYDPWLAADRDHPYIEVVNFRSVDNPAFPKAEYERARQTMPAWRVAMKYDGRLTRPSGVIYEAFDSAAHCVRRFPIPRDWPRYAGVDFGAVNTAAVVLAGETNGEAPTSRFFAYRAYHPARRRVAKVSPAKHVEAILSGEPGVPLAVGGAPSEDEARKDFGAAGLFVREPPIRDVEVGIDRTHALIQQGRLLIFDDLVDLIDELSTYSRELNEQGEPTEKIENKSDFHLLDSLRYISSYLHTTAAPPWTVPAFVPNSIGGIPIPAGVFASDQLRADAEEEEDRGRRRPDEGDDWGGLLPPGGNW